MMAVVHKYVNYIHTLANSYDHSALRSTLGAVAYAEGHWPSPLLRTATSQAWTRHRQASLGFSAASSGTPRSARAAKNFSARRPCRRPKTQSPRVFALPPCAAREPRWQRGRKASPQGAGRKRQEVIMDKKARSKALAGIRKFLEHAGRTRSSRTAGSAARRAWTSSRARAATW